MQVINNYNSTAASSYWQPNDLRSADTFERSADTFGRATEAFGQPSAPTYIVPGRETAGWETLTSAAALDDATLLKRIAQHDIAAFEQLYDQHAPVLYALILRVTEERGLADDLLQETFMHVWNRASDYDGERSATAWLFGIARSKSLDALRWVRRDPERKAAHLETIANEARTGMAAAVELQQALQTISPDQRVCLELAFFAGMTQQQIADYVHLPLNLVRNFITTGIADLQRRTASTVPV